MMNKGNNDAELQRIKALMNYGINESKQPAYSNVEYSKVAADGKLYGIVREGTKYFVKVAKNSNAPLLSENFDYIGGFRNRKNNMFESFASAQRSFGEQMICINESMDNVQKRVITEACYLDEKKEVIAEQTKKIQNEIARQRQIMENAVRISEGKKQETKQEFKEVKGKNTDANSESPKCDAKDCGCIKDYNGKNIKGGVGAPFTVKESTETPLSSRENPEYMDKSHGTEIGQNSGFGVDVNGTEGAVADADGGEAEKTTTPTNVNEGESMHDTDNQNSPSVGVGEKGDTAPFEKTVNESLDDLDDTLDDDDDAEDEFDIELGGDDTEDDADMEGAFDSEDDVETETGDPLADIEDDADVEGNDMEARMDAIESKLDQLLAAMNNMKYDDEELYDDIDSEGEGEDTMDDSGDDFETEDDIDDDTTVVESKSYQAMKARMNEENRLNDFGKHPAYQKKVMTLPSNNNFKRDGQYDMNDGSVDGEQPYGQSKGTQAPFNKSVERIENEITEAVLKLVKKKLG